MAKFVKTQNPLLPDTFLEILQKRSVKKRETSINRNRVFKIALEGGKGKVEEMEILLGKASIIRCFSHARGNIQ